MQINTIHQHDTRRRSHFDVQFFQSDMKLQNVYHKGFIEFNKLPSKMRQEESFHKFKQMVREYFDSNL